MTQTSRSLFQRIRNVRSSLDNAEQSFMNNKDIRGELDLMLAEAELKNLRRKKDVPWNWNRQFLAGCAAVLLVLAGFGGWYVAQDHYRHRAAQAAPLPMDNEIISQTAEPAKTAVIAKTAEQNLSHDITAAEFKDTQERVSISKADMHKLVQSARVELSNPK